MPIMLKISPDQYNIPVERLELSSRTLNCLKRAGVDKVGQVLSMRSSELLQIRNFGEKSLTELHERLTIMACRFRRTRSRRPRRRARQRRRARSRRRRRRLRWSTPSRRRRAEVRHRVAGSALGRPTAHRMLMLRGAVTDLLRYESIRTTHAKARQIRSLPKRRSRGERRARSTSEGRRRRF